jgi:phage tail sheath protein FI
MAQTDRNYHVWFAPAGLKRGLLKLSLETEVNLGKEDTDLLYGNGNVINPIVNYKGKGIVIWGQRTATREASAVDRINVRRMMMQVRKTVEESTAYFVFDPNDETTWRSWKNQISPYLDTIVVGRGFREYKIVMDETTVTDEARDRNEMPGIVYIKPTKTAEFIPIDFVLVAQSATL